MNPFLFVALDGLIDKERETLKLASKLSEEEGDFGFKVNLDFLLRHKMRDVIQRMDWFGRPIFADLKMWNGDRTMTDTISELAELGVAYVNMYALADGLLVKPIKAVEGTGTKVLATTVLTHYDESYCSRHFCRTLAGTVRHFSLVAKERGCHGIILPGTTLENVHDLKLIKCVPGIRTDDFKDNRHKQDVTPEFAVKNGAAIIVCGSPITKSEDPARALQAILSRMKN